MPEGQVLALQKNDSTRDSRVIVSHGSFVSPALPLHENREVDKRRQVGSKHQSVISDLVANEKPCRNRMNYTP